MAVAFFIAPYEPMSSEKAPSDLRIDPFEYQEKILGRRPNAEIETTPDSSEGLSWRLPSEGNISGLRGRLQGNQQVVEFGTGPKSSFVEFILWHRALVPASYQHFLFNSNSWDRLELTPDTTGQDIVDFTGVVE